MGITKADLDAQRAMLARGEEKRKVAKQAEERERLRDTFAAAALTGLIANGDYSVESTPLLSYRMADSMLRERSRTVQTTEDTPPQSRTGTNHDAVPEAKAGSDEVRTDKAAASHRRDGTGDTPSEAEIDALEFVVDAGRVATHDEATLRKMLERLK